MRGLPGGVAHAVLACELVQLVLQVVVEDEPGRGQAGVELLGTARPDDGGGDGWVRQDPGDREGHQAYPGFLGKLAERVDRVELAVVPVAVLVALRGAAEGEAGPLGGGAVRECLPDNRPPAIGL